MVIQTVKTHTGDDAIHRADTILVAKPAEQHAVVAILDEVGRDCERCRVGRRRDGPGRPSPHAQRAAAEDVV